MKFLKVETNWRAVQIILAVAGIIFAAIFAHQQNSINERLFNLEAIGKDPLLQIYFDKAILDNPQNFSAQIHFQNVGSVPVHVVKYGISDFNTGTSRATGTPVTLMNGTVHQFNLGSPGVLAPGKEVVSSIGPTSLKVVNGTPAVWIGVVFTTYPSGPEKCMELNYVPLKEYQKSSPLARECGPWWPEFEGHLEESFQNQ